jgi:ribosomal protein L11 methyltransferase
MKRGPLWQVSVAITLEAEEAVIALLGDIFGRAPVVFADARTGRTSAAVFLEEANALPRPQGVALRAGLRHLRECGLDVGRGRISVRRVPREDWAESWKHHFTPIEIGPSLLLLPSWSRRRAKRGQAVVVLDPGLSFGTGQHPTTRFCLEQIAAIPPGTRASLLDIGTGSGILAIAAAKLGYQPVEAFDIDPEAIRTARCNARRNRVERRIRFVCQDLGHLPIQSQRRFSLICANLTSDLLLSEKERFRHRLEEQGRLVLAGILVSQFAAVRKCYEGVGLNLIAQQRGRGWQSGVFAVG